MKSGKYLAGGLIGGIGGKAIKSFMKSDLYKGLKGDAIKSINKLYSKRLGDTLSNKKFYKGLKKLDIKNQKANIIRQALSMKQGFSNKNFPGLDTNRKGVIGILRGSSNMRKYQKKVKDTASAYLKKKFSKQRDN